jgi:ADP-ribosyl-[dinitrogen reductase] hydrolase
MALCLAISLIVCRDFNPYDQLVRYKWWFQKGYMSSTGQCFDIGASTKQSINEFERRQQDLAKKYQIPLQDIDHLADMNILSYFNTSCGKKEAAGNGGLMRLAPVPLFFHQYPEKAVAYSGRSASLTHGDQKACDACRFYGALIVAAIRGESKSELLHRDFYQNHIKWFGTTPLHEDIMRIAEGSYKKDHGYEDGIRGKGYVVDSLKAALWAFWSDEDSFEKGVLAAINLGDDTDTTAAIYGQLAGAYYGYKTLPERWVNRVYAGNFIRCLSKWIVYEGTEWLQRKSSTLRTPYSTSKL